MVSQNIQDYLKCIYKLGQDATTNQIAKLLDVKAASVSQMLKKLSDLGLVEYTAHKGVKLSIGGEKIALETIRHHRLIETYLAEILGYSLDELHLEAEHLEHHISEKFEDKIAEILGHPTHDPHGDPIPYKDGTLPQQYTLNLTTAQIGEPYKIKRVRDGNSDLLRYLIDIELIPNATVIVTSKNPIDNIITLLVNGKQHIIGSVVSANVYIG